MVDGALEYAQGDKAAALRSLDLARKENSPAQLKQFAEALRSAAAMPGADGVAQPLREVADILSEDPRAPADTAAGALLAAAPVTAPRAMPAVSGSPEHGDRDVAKTHNPNGLGATVDVLEDVTNPYNTRVSTRSVANASTDPSRIFSASHDLSAQEGRTPCKIMGLDAVCFAGREGPLLVSEVIGAPGCSDRLFLGSTESDTTLFGFHWLFEVPYSPIVGARLLVRSGEWLQFAIVPGKKGLSGSSECRLTWSGFRP